MHALPFLRGFGLGLRPTHYPHFLQEQPPVDFVEVISENFMVDGGRPLQVLDQVRQRFPVILHGVSLSIGSADGLDANYLRRLRQLADRVQPLWVSDHLCWTGVDGFNSHDLLPLPHDDETLDLVCNNIDRAQNALGRTLLLENPSTYLAFPGSTRSEAEFITEMCRRTGCHLVLDVNNIYVSATNQGQDPQTWLDGMPLDRVRQIHLAGHSQGQELLIDTHDQPVSDPVWALYAAVCARIGPTATMIERDDHIPPLPELLAELDQARDIAARAERRAA